MRQSKARERLEDAFSDLPVRQELRFLINNEVNWLIKAANVLPSIRDDGWNRKAQRATERFSDLARALHECVRSMPPSAVRQIASQMGSSTPEALLLLHMAVRAAVLSKLITTIGGRRGLSRSTPSYRILTRPKPRGQWGGSRRLRIYRRTPQTLGPGAGDLRSMFRTPVLNHFQVVRA
jgi:hypothetical protein